MPDISMCKNTKCRLKKSCYRYMAIPLSYQTYGDFEPTINDSKKCVCEYYWSTRNKTNVYGK